MPFDRAAHRQQTARIVEHYAGEDVWLKLDGKGDEFPAVISSRDPQPTRARADVGAKAYEFITIAREAFAGRTLPREGQHFRDRAGRIYRIHEDRTTPHASSLVYACGSAAKQAA